MAAMVYGPKSVIVIAGINKIVKTQDDALARVRMLAAPINVQRFPQLKLLVWKQGFVQIVTHLTVFAIIY